MITFNKMSGFGTVAEVEVSEVNPLPSISGLRGPVYTTTIVSGTTISSSGTVMQIADGYRVSYIVAPSGFTSGTVNYQGSEDGLSYVPISGTAVDLTISASELVYVGKEMGELIATPRYLKVACPSQTNTVVLRYGTKSI